MITRFLTSLSWMNRDARLITLARGIRTFSQSFIAVIMAIYLAELGFSLVQIGAVLTVGVAGVSFFALVVGVVSERVGRRRLLVLFSLLAAAAGLAMYFADAFIPLLVIAFLGSLSTGGGGGESPAQPLEVAILPDTGPPERRTDIFAVYSIVARTGTFLGALAAGLPVLLQDALACRSCRPTSPCSWASPCASWLVRRCTASCRRGWKGPPSASSGKTP